MAFPCPDRRGPVGCGLGASLASETVRPHAPAREPIGLRPVHREDEPSMTSPHDPVPLLDLKAQFRTIRDDVMGAVERVMESQGFILGPEVACFEESIARTLEVSHAVGMTSGSDALVAALRALDVGPGDGVLCPTFTFFATAGAASRLGATPIFLDLEDESMNLCLDALERYLATSVDVAVEASGPVARDRARGLRLRAVVPVHLFGQPLDMNRLEELVAPFGIAVVEDACQAIGARFKGRAVGSFGKAACFSFFPSKNLGAAGDAGLVTTQDAAFAARLRRLRVHGSETRYYHQEVGYNFRLDALQAAVLGAKLPHLQKWNQARRAVAQNYRELFSSSGLDTAQGGPVRTPRELPDRTHVYHQFVIRVPAQRRDGLVAALEAARIGTAIYYPVPLHLQDCFRSLGYRPGDIPRAEETCTQVLALPIYPELTMTQQKQVVDRIAHHFAR